jgi:hypothetical protein
MPLALVVPGFAAAWPRPHDGCAKVTLDLHNIYDRSEEIEPALRPIIKQTTGNAPVVSSTAGIQRVDRTTTAGVMPRRLRPTTNAGRLPSGLARRRDLRRIKVLGRILAGQAESWIGEAGS